MCYINDLVLMFIVITVVLLLLILLPSLILHFKSTAQTAMVGN